MPNLDQLLIFLASPGDVPSERKYVSDVVDDVNRTVANPRGIMLTVKQWEKDTFSAYGAEPQALINAQIADMKQYALFVGIMFNRIGTPTNNSESGTVEEFERAVTARKKTQAKHPEIMFFFRQSPTIMKRQEELDQKSKVLAFRHRIQKQAVTTDYKSPLDFRGKLHTQLLLWLNAYKPDEQKPANTKTVPRLSAAISATTSNTNALRAVKPREIKASGTQGKPRMTVTAASARKTVRNLSEKNAVLLNDAIYIAESVHTAHDESVSLRILPRDATEKAALNSLRPSGYHSRTQISYAYQDDGFTCEIASVESESINGATVVVITLKPDAHQSNGGYDSMTVNGISSNEIVNLRIRLLLLNEEPSGPNFSGIMSIRHFVTNLSGPIKIEKGIFPELWTDYKGNPREFLIFARLMAIYYLKASHSVDHILELKLDGPKANTITLKFRGNRRSAHQSGPMTIVECQGTVSLSK